MFTGGILTVSDTGAKGERQDTSGQVIQECLAPLAIQWLKYGVVPDETETISDTLRQWCDEGLDIILTTGGTGLAPRDVTPDATLAVVDRIVPGFTEVMRLESFRRTPLAVLSRAVAGTRKNTLIINLPGSPKAVAECLESISPAIPHAIETLRGQASECARG